MSAVAHELVSTHLLQPLRGLYRLARPTLRNAALESAEGLRFREGDLNRILQYGLPDGTLAETPQRRVLHIADAMVAGQGDGPLAAEPLALGLLLGGGNPAAMDWVGAHLLGYDPRRVALTRGAFGHFRWPITAFGPDEVRLIGDLGDEPGSLAQALAAAQSVKHPPGWRDSAAAWTEAR